MPTFTIQTPRGDSVDIDAADQASAIRGAQAWDMEDFAHSEASRLGVDPDLAVKVLRQESNSHPNPEASSAGAIGPMQLMPATAKDLGVDPNDPYQNITGGLTYLKQQRDHFGRDDLALAAYNAGPGAVTKHGGIPPYQQTQDYVRAILGDNWQPPAAPGPQGAPQAASGAPAATPAAPGLPPIPDSIPYVMNRDTQKPYNDAQEATLRRMMMNGEDISDLHGEVEGSTPIPGKRYVALDGSVKTAPPLTLGEQAADIANSAGSGLGKTAAAFADDMAAFNPVSKSLELGQKTLDVAHHFAPGVVPQFQLPQMPSFSAAQPDYTPKTMGGRFTQVGAENAANALLTPGGIVRKAASVAIPAVAQKLAGDAAKDAGANDVGQFAAQAAGNVAGQLASGFGLRLPQRVPNRTPEQLRTEAKALYGELRTRGVQFTRNAVDSLNIGLDDLIHREDPGGSIPQLAEHRGWVASVRAQLAADPSVENLDRVRSNLQKALATPTASTDPNSLRVGRAMLHEIDQFMAASARRPTLMTTASPREAARVQQILGQARDTWRRLSNVETVNNLAASAGIQNDTSHMGGNKPNMTARKLRPFLDPSTNKELAGLSPAELAQLRRSVTGQGAPIYSSLKLMGNLSPRKGIGWVINPVIGAAFGPHTGLATMAIGGISHEIASRMQQANLDRLVRMLSSGVAGRPGGLTYTPNPAAPLAPGSVLSLQQQLPQRQGQMPQQ